MFGVGCGEIVFGSGQLGVGSGCCQFKIGWVEVGQWLVGFDFGVGIDQLGSQFVVDLKSQIEFMVGMNFIGEYVVVLRGWGGWLDEYVVYCW